MEKIKRQFTGIVTSTAMVSTVVVRVDRVKIHPRYHKRYVVSKKYHCDYKGKDIKNGDEVLFAETRPISKNKRWKIVGKAK